MPVRDAEFGAEYVADAVACAHRHAAGERAHGQPGADLAIEPRRQVAWLSLDSWQPLRKERQALECLGIGVWVGFIGADAFDAVIDRANARRKPEPLGCIEGDGWVEDHRARDDPRMPEQLFHVRALVSNTGDGAELSGRKRSWNANLPNARR